MNTLLKKISAVAIASTIFLSAPLALAATSDAPAQPPALDVSKLTPEQKAAFDKLTPQQKADILNPPIPADAKTSPGSSNTSGSQSEMPAPATGGGLALMYVLVGIGALVVIGLGLRLAHRKSNTQA